MSSLQLIIFIIILSVIISAVRMIFYIRSVRTSGLFMLFSKINTWHKLILEESSPLSEIKKKENQIEELFEKKIYKTALLHFNEKFILKYLDFAGVQCDHGSTIGTFENLSGIGLKKTRQSLKILSIAFGHKFNLDNYSFYNYWLILKGNSTLYKENKKDAEGRIYSRNDVEKPFEVLEYYFANIKNNMISKK